MVLWSPNMGCYTVAVKGVGGNLYQPLRVGFAAVSFRKHSLDERIVKWGG